MICVNCGKETHSEKPVCDECRIKALGVKRKGILNLVACPKCGALKTYKRWLYSVKKEEIGKSIVKLYSGRNAAIQIEVDNDEIDLFSEDGAIDAEVSVIADDSRSTFHEEIPYSISKESCPRCNKATGSYFEAIVQIRGITGAYSPLLDRVFDHAADISDRTRPNITKVTRRNEGLDVFFGSFKIAEAFSRKLTELYFSLYSVTKKLSGRSNGLDLYRYTYLVRLADLYRGAVVKISETPYIVLSVHKRTLTLMGLPDRKVIVIDSAEFFSSRFRVIDNGVNLESYSLMYRSGDEMQIVSPDGMNTLAVKGIYDDDHVDVVYYQGEYYALPPQSVKH